MLKEHVKDEKYDCDCFICRMHIKYKSLQESFEKLEDSLNNLY